MLAGSYLLLGSGYIAVSSTSAFQTAATGAELYHIELAKGLAFIAVTAVLLYAGARLVFARLLRQSRELELARRATALGRRQSLVGILVLAVVHDFRNLLQVAIGNCDLLRQGVPAEHPSGHLVQEVQTALERLNDQVQRIHSAGRRTAAEANTPLDLNALVRESVSLAQRHPSARNATLTVEDADAVRCEAIPALVQDALFNLALNAVQAAGAQARVLVRVRRENGVPVLEVHDNGPGIAPDVAATLFDPYVTTKEGGTGLGLLSVQACADAHGGRVTWGTSALGGASFRLTLAPEHSGTGGNGSEGRPSPTPT